MASAEFEQLRQQPEAVEAWLIWIHWDAFDTIPAKDFYFSSTENIDFPVGDPPVEQTFQGRLMAGIPKGRHQKDRGGDYCEFSFLNAGNAQYVEFADYYPIIERGRVRVYHLLQSGLDYYEGDQIFDGYLKDYTISEKDKTLKFSAFSDMSRTGFPVAATILTRERCRAEFNVNGVAAPDAFRLCTWQTIQGGNPLFCSKYLKGVDGCIAHGNAHQFAAIEGLSTAEIEFVPAGQVDFPYENLPCFTENVFICDENWNIQPISFAKVGMTVKATNIFTGEVTDAQILEVQRHEVTEFSIAEFARGSVLEVTKEHLFRVKRNVFAPVGSLKGKWCCGFDSAKKTAQDQLRTIMGVSKRQTVYNLRTTSHTYLVTDKDALFYFDVHNNKNSIPINL